MPPHRLDHAVEVLLELPRQPALADAGGATHPDETRPALPPGRMEQVLEEPQLLVPAGEGSLQPVGTSTPPAPGHHPERPPGPGGRPPAPPHAGPRRAGPHRRRG